MNNNHLPKIAGGAVALIILVYLVNFFPIFGAQLSGDTAVWGQFGDYIGGTLNPILSFISVVLLIRSLSLQNEANDALRNELKNSERTENFRTFSTLFFSMIESQKSIFNDFKIGYQDGTGDPVVLRGSSAVIFIENQIETLRQNCDDDGGDKRIVDFLDELDSEDRIFGILRAFYVTVRTICEKLRDEKDFGEKVAKEQLTTLINFTDFSQLRLIMIGAQFLNYKSCTYLKDCELFKVAIAEVGLKMDMY